ncbi:MAG TPA: hypothetical protein VFA63_19465 [Pseudonocardiaceae bacterium]|nr:hypothetical protein [Pseudonocardiaceae bacterium]
MSELTLETSIATTLLTARERCARQGLLGSSEQAGLSARLPGKSDFLFLGAAEATPRRLPVAAVSPTLHATIYQLRPDVGAVLSGGGVFASMLHDFGATMPVGFDEQARHLGRMPGAASPVTVVTAVTAAQLGRRLADGANSLLVGDLPVCLGMTCQRLVLNAELLEKCAKAYVLAAATGQAVGALPWWVCRIAMRRLRKDQRRAAERFSQGLLPEETRGY